LSLTAMSQFLTELVPPFMQGSEHGGESDGIDK